MSGTAIVRRVDHVSVLVSDPQPLFSTLTSTLGLPVGWPVGRFVGFVGGGVVLGNVTLEIIRFAPGRRSRVPLDQGEIAVALEPIATDEAVKELDRRGIPHAPAIPYSGRAEETPTSEQVGWSAGSGPLWTVTLLGGFFGDADLGRSYSRPGSRSRAVAAMARAASSASARIGRADALLAASLPSHSWAFLCDYHRLDLGEARRASQALLDETGGGPLGVEGLREIVIEASEPDAELRRWEALLAPRQADADGRFEFYSGPALRIVPGQSDHQALVLSVRSLATAEAFLGERDLLAGSSASGLTLDPSRVGGLDLRLIEAQSHGGPEKTSRSLPDARPPDHQ